MSRFGVSYHCYADDTQLYIPIKHNDNTTYKRLQDCLHELKLWLTNNFLLLNDDKTQIIQFGPNELSDRHCTDLGTLTPQLTFEVKNLGFYLDSSLKLTKQINATVRASFYHLRRLAKVKPFLNRNSFETIIHAFISTQLDYCNSLYVGLPLTSISRLQMVQNAAARLLTGSRKQDHITPILRSLHWLPVRYRIDFKILLFVYKSLNNQAPKYLSNLISIHNPSRSLRSRDHHLLAVPRSRLKRRGDRAFAVVGPKLWNTLPLHVKSASTLAEFKSLLKTHFFSNAFNVP